jgi:hypothetical protein
METQALLYARSAEIPEGLYLELMNKLKLDFDNKPKVRIVLIDDNEMAKMYLDNCKKIKAIKKLLTLAGFIFLNISIHCFYQVYLLIKK